MTFKKVLVLSFFIAVHIYVPQAVAHSLVWKVSKGNTYFYLGGTLHVLAAEDYPLPSEYNVAYTDADIIVFETDLVLAASPQFQNKMMQYMTYHDERTLSHELTAQVYQQLIQFMTTRGIDSSHFTRFKPWAVALTLTLMEYQRLGMMGEIGIDMHFYQRALQDKKITSSLETTDEQFNAMLAMSSIEPNQAITSTLHDIEQLPVLIKSMKAAWRSGDLNALLDSSLIVKMKLDAPDMYQTLVVERNNNWMRVLPLLVHREGIEFVMVGAMHLVGEEGLLYLLQQQGFKVEPL